ncbi:unnamed protein product [Moneuplotes crassus]|uniref:Uncharacterized protein n=1 Tax=Euplotes crassus TaxID=5936 RepID=A0AAD1Y1M5_EUPCR|nr:unnamed protein product [Moneuplotes crassus]
MRRTKNRVDVDGVDTAGISGLRLFEGEDLSFQERMKWQKERQLEMIKEQLREKKLKEMQDKQEEDEWAEQTDMLTKMRGMLEEENHTKRSDKEREIQEENMRLALIKKQREQEDKNWNETMNATETYRD